MPIQRTPLPIQFAGGIATKEDHKSIPATKLINLENATFTKQTTLSKRNGYEALGTLLDDGSALPVCVGMATRGSETIVFDGSRAYSYRESTDTWADAGEVASVVNTERVLARTGTNQTHPDFATNGGVTVVAWEDSRGGVWMTVLEDATGRVLLIPTQLDATATRPRCVPAGDVLHVYYARGDINRIYSVVVNPNAPGTTPAPAIMVDDLNTTHPNYDACPTNRTNDPALIAWVSTTGWRVAYVAPDGALGSPVNGYPAAATYADSVDGGIACAWDEERPVSSANIGVAFTTAAGVTTIYQVDYDDLTSSSSDAVDSSGVGTRTALAWDDAAALWWATEYDGATANVNYIRSGSISGATVSAVQELRGHCIVNRALNDNGDVYLPVSHAVEFFTYVAVCKLTADTFGETGTVIVARMLPGASAGEPPRVHLSSSHTTATRTIAMALSDRIQLDAENGDQFSETGIRIASLDFDHESSFQYAELGRGLYLAGASLQHYDGRRWAEHDFHCAPDLVAGASSPLTTAAVGGSIPDGSHSYVFCYEEVDALGEVHYGAVSAPFLITTAGGNVSTVTAVIPTYRLTSKKHVRIGVFRAPTNQTGDQSSIPYYRVTNTDPSDTAGSNCYVTNDTTADTISFTDAISDTALLAREPLYTNGGILSNDPVPISGNCIAGGKARLFWTDPTDSNLIRYSQQIREEAALETCAPLTLTLDPYGGRIVGIGILDGAVVVFKETAVYAFGGPGPLANPEAGQDGFSPADLLTSDVGCKAPNSIAQSPNGIAFQSEKGIKLIDRSRQVQDIGSAVYGFNDQTVTRATLLPDRHQVLFLTADGYALLWDYEREQWSKYTNHEGYDGVVVDGTYRYLRTDGRVFAETPGVYRDDNTHIVMKIETAWIKLTGYLQGWQRVIDASFLGEYKSAHTLVVRYRIDYGTGYSQPIELDVDSNFDPSLYGAGPYGAGFYGGDNGYGTVYQRTIPAINQRCQAISFRIEDSEATDDYGAAFELSELLITGGVLGNKFMVGEARR